VMTQPLNLFSWGMAVLILLAAPCASASVQLPSATTTAGYVCRLLINEVPFPGEKGYHSEAETKAAMEQLVHVLDGRLKNVPAPYRQQHVAAIRTDDLIDVITVGGVKGQFDGFYRNTAGNPVMVPRVTARANYLLQIAGQGAPGRFARLLNHAASTATRYTNGRFSASDRFADVITGQGIPATGRAFSWMTDEMRFHPGGNFLRISDVNQGSLGGNRFFTLRKEPK
jgi:hypothetical protein